MVLTWYDVDPDGDVRAILAEPTGPFAPAARVGESRSLDINCHNNPPVTEEGNGTESHASETEDADAQTNVSQDTRQTEFSLRLSSKHLMLASLYVRKMYSGAWKDSADRDKAGLLVWRVGGLFDSDAFVIVMNAIHGLNRKVPRVVDLELLAKVAVITDYLQCHESMEILSVMWIDGLKNSMPETFGRKVILWIMVSSIFRNQEVFGSATRTAILRSENEVPSDGLPIHGNTIDKIEQRRHDLLIQLIGFLYDAVARLRVGLCKPECDAMLLGCLITQVEVVDLLQPRNDGQVDGISVETVLQTITGLSTPLWYLPSELEPYSLGGYSKKKMLKKNRGLFNPSPVDAQPADELPVPDHNRDRCTLGALFHYVEGLEAGVSGLDLEDVLGP